MNPTSTDPTRFVLVFVEDDEPLRRLIRRFLEAHGVVVLEAPDGPTGLALVARHAPDVVLLDLGLPGLDGVELCRQVRQFSAVPIVMLTARDGELDRVRGLDQGADDYVLKPFSSPELLARLRAHVRRSRGLLGPRAPSLRAGELVIDVAARSARLRGRELPLTPYEFALLRALAERPGRVLSREQLIELVRGSADESFDRSIDVHVSNLRRKLGDDPRAPTLLRTVRGVGYLLSSGGE
ncbi:MAG TPA: response regulator transcription factor [Polyangiaceae bacterium]|nr:response regulator transcription factor [Polyangiaceae bacterium]